MRETHTPRYFLVGGTRQELLNIARELGITSSDIRLVQHPSDIHGHRGGEIIFGYTGEMKYMEEIIGYARAHDIRIP